MKLKASIRQKVNKALYPTTTVYHDAIPLDDIFACLKSEGLIVVDEAGQPWEGMLLGSDSNATFDLQLDGEAIDNAVLILSWYKMPSSRWEINCYVS